MNKLVATILGQSLCNASVLSVGIAPDISLTDSNDLQVISSHVRECLDTIVRIVHEIGCGFLTTCEYRGGYGITAIFGTPIPLDDHPRQAVRAALTIITSFRGKENDLPLYMGIDSGELLVGTFGPSSYPQFSAFGLPVHRAICLRDHSLPGCLLITRPVLEVSRDLVGVVRRRRVKMIWPQRHFISAFEVQGR